MDFQKNLMDVGKERITQLRSFLDELEVQMALGKAEARDAFEREKKTLNRFINQEKAELKKMSKAAEEHRSELLAKFETLEAKISHPLPTAKRKFDKQKKETLQAIYELEAGLKETYGDVSREMQNRLDAFKGKLDAYRVQLALGSYEDEAKLEKRKAELKEAVGEIREKLQKEAESGSKVEHFVEEVSESFEHFKKAFSDLFS